MEPASLSIHVLPGGSLPERMTKGAIGYDVRIRALVSPNEMDPEYPLLRKTLFNFNEIPEDPRIAGQVYELRRKNGDPELVYRMEPGESVLAGIGFVTEMPFPLFYWVAPRSGLASRWNITVTNAPGTVDPDYRGEAGVLIYNRGVSHFDLRRGMRIAQIIFQHAVIPEFSVAAQYEDLLVTDRNVGGFGSTGMR